MEVDACGCLIHYIRNIIVVVIGSVLDHIGDFVLADQEVLNFLVKVVFVYYKIIFNFVEVSLKGCRI